MGGTPGGYPAAPGSQPPQRGPATGRERGLPGHQRSPPGVGGLGDGPVLPRTPLCAGAGEAGAAGGTPAVPGLRAAARDVQASPGLLLSAAVEREAAETQLGGHPARSGRGTSLEQSQQRQPGL